MKFGKDIINITIPIMIEQVSIMIMGAINGIMVGRLGKEAVSAIGMIDPINNIFISFFSALALGGTVIAAYYAGQNNYRSVNETVKHAMFLGTITATSIAIIMFFFRYTIIWSLYSSAERKVIDNSLIYFNITLFTYPFIALVSIGCGILRGVGDTKTPMKIIITMNIVNAILSYILIYGVRIGASRFCIDIPGFGIKGAALGLASARIIGALLILYVLLNGTKLVQLTINRNFKINIELFKSIFRIAFPASIESLFFNGGKLIIQVFIVGMGTASIAADYIVKSIFSLINIPGSALSIAATTMTGQYMGRSEDKEAKAILMYLTKISSLCLIVVCVPVFPLAHFLATMYTKNSDVIEIATQLIRTFVIPKPLLWPLAFIIPAGLKGAGDTKYTMGISIFSMWTFRIGLGYILSVIFKMGIMGIWIGMHIDWVVRAILFYARWKREKWKGNIVIKDENKTL